MLLALFDTLVTAPGEDGEEFERFKPCVDDPTLELSCNKAPKSLTIEYFAVPFSFSETLFYSQLRFQRMMKTDPAAVVVPKCFANSCETQGFLAIHVRLEVPPRTGLKPTCSDRFAMTIGSSNAVPSSNNLVMTVLESPRAVMVARTTIPILTGSVERLFDPPFTS